MPEIYEPREDTYLILNEVRRYASGNVLDMGTGTGVLAIAAAEKAENVIGVDINKEALEHAKENSKAAGLTNVKFVYSDLFSYFKKYAWRFDLIIFNPPYLPEDIREPKESRVATTGGKKGYEILDRFFSEVSEYLMPYGKILIVFSSLTGQDKVHEIIENYGFNYQKISEEELFAETLFVYLAEKSDLLRGVEMNGIREVVKIARGHRGLIYTGWLDNKKIVIKKQREDVPVIGRIANEARWLKVLNKKGMGAKFIYFEDNYFVYEYVEGDFIINYLKKANKGDIKKVINDVFHQCFILDQLKVNKEEMHKPLKHILVKGTKPVLIDARKSKISGISKTPKVVLIDFERTHITHKPKNVTQFCQFVASKRVLDILKGKGFRFNKTQIISAAKKYKKEINEKNLKEIIKLLT